MNLQLNQCKTCGGDLHRVGNYYVCQACGNKWTIDAADDVHVVDRANAWSALRDGDFDRSAELFELIHEKQPKDHEAYWGLALACAGVMYVVDYVEHKRVPTCNNIDEASFLNSNNVKKAIELAPSEIASGYRQQAEQIEQIRVEWLQKARKEKPYDVFLSYKDSDRENGIDRTQDSVDAQNLYQLLVNEGFRVFFSRVSLHDKISEHYEPYIYNAIKTAKVMIVFGEKPEYFNATWVRNEWTRFRRRIENGEKDKNSLIVVTKNMNSGDLPVALRSRQALNADEMTFSTDLVRHIRAIVDAAKSNEHVKRRDVQSGIQGWTSKTITANTISKRELSQQNVVTSIDERKSLSVAETFIKEKQWEEANEILESMLAKNHAFAEAVWCQLLVRHKVSSNTVLMRMLDHFKPEDYALVEKALNCASKEFAGRILDLFYQSGKILPTQVRKKVYDMILPYRYERRTQQLKENFNWSISNHDFPFFKLLLSALEQNDVDAYIEYNSRYIKATLDHQEKRECTENILAVDEGNRVARMYLFESALSTSTKLEPIVKAFEDVLKYSQNIDADVEDALVMTSAVISSQVHCDFARQLPTYYRGDLKTLRRSLLAVGTRMREKSYFEPAQYFFTLLVSLDDEDVDAYWGLCLSKIHAATEDQVINQPILLKDQPEYTKLLSLIDGERRVACMRLAKKQQNTQKSRRRKRLRIVIGSATAAALVVGAVVTVTVILPNNQMKKANELFASGNYAAAGELYQKLGSFDDSSKRAEAVKAILQVEASNHAQAVETLLAQGIPVEITYKAEGGLLGGTEALALGHTLSTDGSIIPLDAEEPADGVSELTSTYQNAADFGGLKTPVKTGYRFAGWLTDTYSYDISGQDPVFHMVLKASWEVQTYAINYELDGGTLQGDSPKEYTIESATVTVPKAEKDGYEFKGWICDGATEPVMEVTIPAGSHGNKTFYAQWVGESYSVTLDHGYAEGDTNKTQTIQIQCGSQLELDPPARPGYEFLGWWENDTTRVESHIWERREDIRLVAKWRRLEYTIHYHANKGRLDESNPTEYNVESESFTLKNPTREGYTFLGWSASPDGSAPVAEMTVAKGSTGNLELFAVWAVNESTVTLDANGGTCAETSMKVTYGKQFTLPRPERSGYTFVGWKLNGATVNGGICTITADCTLVAEWKAVSYSITYRLDGGTNHNDNPADYTVEDTVTLKDPSRVGYKFLGWIYNGMSTPTKNLVITGDLVGVREFTAVWEVAKSKVTLNAGGGQHSIQELDVTYGDDMKLGGTPTWAGHKFLGWYVDGDRSKPVTSGICRLERDTELVALWEYEQYTISYNLDGGTNHADNPDVFTCDDTVVLRTPTKKGYVFAGWLVDGQGSPVMDVTIGKGTMVNQSYTAKWEAVKTTVTLDAGEGTVSQGTYGAEYGEDYALPTPTRTGYRFLGWMLGGEDIPSEGVWNREDTALTLQAKWEAKVYTVTLQNIRDYTCVVTLNANYVGGETTSKIFPASDPMDYPLPAEREGYVFAGWYTDVACSDGHLFDFTQNLTAGITLYAKWVGVADYCNGAIPLNGDSEEFSLALGEENLYAFVSPKDGFVTVYTQHHDGGDPYLQLYDENMNRLDGMHDDDHGDSDAEVTWEVDGGHVYYVGVGSYSSGIGSIHLDLGYEIDGGRVGIDGKEGFHYELGPTVTVKIQYDELLDWGIPQYEDATFVGWRDIATQQILQNGSAWTLDADSRLEAVWQ